MGRADLASGVPDVVEFAREVVHDPFGERQRIDRTPTVHDLPDEHGDGERTEQRTEDRPELTEFCARINEFLTQIENSFSILKESMAAVSEGRISGLPTQDIVSEGDFQELNDNFSKTLGLLANFVRELRNCARAVSSPTSWRLVPTSSSNGGTAA